MLQFDAKSLDWAKTNGMIPTIVQNCLTGKVLMHAYVTRESLEKTLETGLATFFSRSRQQLWCKGEESKNYLYVQAVTTDCDRDTLLFSCVPAGPTCHRGTESCFDGQPELPLAFLEQLDLLSESRKGGDPEESYTAKLFSKGNERIAKKVGEEATETVIAAMKGDREELTDEAADLLYHLDVLLRNNDLSLSDVVLCLAKRHGNFDQYKILHAIKKSQTV